MTYKGKEYNTLYCIPCSEEKHNILSELGYSKGIYYF